MFRIEKKDNGSFCFSLFAKNGQKILRGGEYYTEIACNNGIELVKKYSQDATMFQNIESSDGKHYFYLKAINGQIIGESLMYESESARDNGIESVKKNSL